MGRWDARRSKIILPRTPSRTRRVALAGTSQLEA
jgi:hypothetical protein